MPAIGAPKHETYPVNLFSGGSPSRVPMRPRPRDAGVHQRAKGRPVSTEDQILDGPLPYGPPLTLAQAKAVMQAEFVASEIKRLGMVVKTANISLD